MTDRSREKVNDYTSQPLLYLFLWGIPFVGLVVTYLVALPVFLTTVMVTVAFAWIGTACLLNALQIVCSNLQPTGPQLVKLENPANLSQYSRLIQIHFPIPQTLYEEGT